MTLKRCKACERLGGICEQCPDWRRRAPGPIPDVNGDPVNRPAHYTKHPSGVECITVTEHFNFNRGNAIKYIWRAGEKGDELEDLKKARWYIDREIARIEAAKKAELKAAFEKDNKPQGCERCGCAPCFCPLGKPVPHGGPDDSI